MDYEKEIMTTTSANTTTVVEDILRHYKDTEGALLVILHAIQDQLGYVPSESIRQIAHALSLSRAEVHGVISFYHDFRTSPAGQNVIQICRAEACQAMGSRALEAHAKESLGLEYGETSSDDSITLEAVYCLGNCACSPSVRIGNDIYARVDAKKFDELVLGIQRGKG